MERYSATCFAVLFVQSIADQSSLNRFLMHAEQRNKIAHDDMFANYVCPGGKHYPLEFRRFKKRAQCETTGETFENHTKLFCQLIDWVCERDIPGDFAFDSYFANAEKLQ